MFMVGLIMEAHVPADYESGHMALPHYKSEHEDAQSRRKGLLALYNFCVGSRGSIQIENLFAQD